MNKVIKLVNVKATFPGGRVVTGVTRTLHGRSDEAIQVWLKEDEPDSILVNPALAETIEFTVEYEK